MSDRTEAAVELPYRAVLDAVGSRSATLGGGSVAALVAAAAAALVERCAAVAGAREARASASTLRAILEALVDEDAAALEMLVRAREATRTAAAAAASEPPARLREAAREVATLATTMERDGNAALRGEARCAILFAEAAVAAADAIISLNDGLARRARPGTLDA